MHSASMHRHLPLSVLGVLMAAAVTAGLVNRSIDQMPELSQEQVHAALEQGVILRLADDRGRIDEDLATQLLAAAYRHGDVEHMDVVAVSRGAFRYASDPDSPSADDAWLVAISNVEATCFGGDMCPDPPTLGTEVVALRADDLEPIGDFWVS